MTPSEYVRGRISNGRKSEVIQMLKNFCDTLDRRKSKEHLEVYWFARIFVMSVAMQLQYVNNIEDLNRDGLLVTWGDLGWFGIDRVELAEMSGLTD